MYARTRHARARLVVGMCVAIAACQHDTPFAPVREPPEQKTPALILITAGDQQAGFPGEVMSTLIVEVLDQNNNWVMGAEVGFEVSAGGGTVSAGKALTGPSGRAAVTWTLGPTPGVNAVVASVADLPGVTFTARGLGPGLRFDLEEFNGHPSNSVGISGFVFLEDGYYLARFEDWWFETCVGHGTFQASSTHVTFTAVVPACYTFTHTTTATLDGETLIVEQESSAGSAPTRWVFRTRDGSGASSKAETDLKGPRR
jgi:hypothetical protein